MPSFQEMVDGSKPGDGDHTIDFIVRVRTHGKEGQAWQSAARLAKHLEVVAGSSVTFHLLDGTELTGASTRLSHM